MPSSDTQETWLHKCKCMHCGLHFIAFSWHENWKPVHCPECGSRGGFIHWQEATSDFIFEHVPGQSTLMVGIG
jgi:hypothetical protein